MPPTLRFHGAAEPHYGTFLGAITHREMTEPHLDREDAPKTAVGQRCQVLCPRSHPPKQSRRPSKTVPRGAGMRRPEASEQGALPRSGRPRRRGRIGVWTARRRRPRVRPRGHSHRKQGSVHRPWCPSPRLLIAKPKRCWGEPAGPPQHRNSLSPSGHFPTVRYLFELRPRRRPARKPPREPAILPVLNAQRATPAQAARAISEPMFCPFRLRGLISCLRRQPCQASHSVRNGHVGQAVGDGAG